MGQKLPKIAHIFLGKTKIENPAPCCDVGWVHLGGTAVRICGAKRAGRKLNLPFMGKTIVGLAAGAYRLASARPMRP